MITERERQLLDWIAEDPMISQQELADKAGITRSSVAVHISNLMKKGSILGKGYILQKGPYLVVVGAVNMDIFGRPAQKLIPQDSNPGAVRLSLGGVGRNIAHNLALLGTEVKLLTAFGEDLHAQEIRRSCRELGIDVSASLTVPDAATSSYLFITDEEGEMQLAVSDMTIYDRLTPQVLRERQELICHAELCVMDANLPQETLCWLAENCTCPIFADTVSTTKAKKLLPLLDKIHTLKPNRIEAELLTGIAITDRDSLEAAASALLERGVRRVFLSLGSHGVYCAEGDQRLLLPCDKGPVASATGAGDSFTAALAWAYLQGFDLEQSARAGLAAARICVASAETVSPALSEEALLEQLDRSRKANTTL